MVLSLPQYEEPYEGNLEMQIASRRAFFESEMARLQSHVQNQYTPPTKEAWNQAKDCFIQMLDSGLDPKDFGPTADESVQLCYFDDGKKAIIEFFNDGSISYLTRKDKSEPEAYEIDAKDLKAAIAKFSNFFEGN